MRRERQGENREERRKKGGREGEGGARSQKFRPLTPSIE